MATISELNVRLGLLYKDFDKSLTAVEKRLERSGRKFSQLGNDLALSISLPLAALGASAVKQAGEIEALKLAMTSTFQDAGRSAGEAAKEVDALREAAKAPGLDFEQAIKGSIRLQGVGLSAEQARKTLTEMANAIALTGGTAQELDGVTRQFAQMISKGRVLQEDVSILAENMPKISDLMQKAFGTRSVEAIRNMGVSGAEFVQRITEAATQLARVEGGIKNALVNAGAEARQSLAALGEAIVKAFDVTGKIESVTKAINGAVTWFKSLSESTQSAIVSFGAFLVVVGPAVKVIGALYGGLGQVVGGFRTLVDATKGVTAFLAGMTQSTVSVTQYIKQFAVAMLGGAEAATRLRVAVIASTAGLAAIVLGIAAAVYAMSDNFDAARFASEKFAEAQRSVNEEAKGEVAQLNKNIDTLKDVRSSTEDRKKAADALLEAYPNYLRGIDLEKASLTKLNEIQERLTQSIIRGIAERKKAQAVNAIYEKQADILLRIQEIQRTGSITTGEATLINTGDLLRAGSNAAAVIEKLKQQVSDLGTQANTTAKDFDKAFGLESRAIDPLLEKEYAARAAAEDARDAFLGFGDSVKKSTEVNQAAVDAAKKKAEKMAETWKQVENSIDAVNKKQAELGADFVGEKTKEIEAGVERLIEAGFSPTSAPVQKLKGYLKQIRDEIARGFSSNNQAQTSIGVTASAPASLGTIKLPTQVVSIDTSRASEAVNALRDLQAAAIADIDAKREAASQAEITRIQQEVQARQAAGSAIVGAVEQLGSNIIALNNAKAEAEKAQLDEEYARKLEAAQGDAKAQERIQNELAAKKAAVDKKRGKQSQNLAIALGVIDTASGVLKALSSAPPPYNFVLAALTAAAGAVQIATIKSQKFADGGVITKPTFGLMGEYPGASSNPEIVTPERLMRSVFREEAGRGGGPVQVYGVIKGSDILLSSERASSERNRTR